MKKTMAWVAVIVGMAGVSSASLVSVAVDFTNSRNQDGNTVLGTAADFQANDANFDLTGVVLNTVQNSGTAWTQYGTLTPFGASGLAVQTTGGAGGYTAKTTDAWTGDVPILESYLYGMATNNSQVMTFSGLASYASGETITVTAYGIGDNTGQQSTFLVNYGSGSQTGSTYFGDTRLGGENAQPFTQLTFAADGTDTLTVESTSNINGVSLSVIPEPATFGLLAVFGGGVLFIRRRFII